jgi:hypothetical protein
MKTLLTYSALICLLTTAFLSNATSAGSGVVLVPAIRVVRANRIESWNALKTDTELQRVTNDVAEYLETHPIQMLDPAARATDLGQNHNVTSADDDNYYMYIVGPDGETHEMCLPKPIIEIESAEADNPILVNIEWHVDFS